METNVIESNDTPHARVLTGINDDSAPKARELVAVGDSTLAGRQVWWRLSGDVPRETFAAEWVKNGGDKDLLPKPLGLRGILGHAARAMKAQGYLARPVGGGYVLVREHKGGKSAKVAEAEVPEVVEATSEETTSTEPKTLPWEGEAVLHAYIEEDEVRIDSKVPPLIPDFRAQLEHFRDNLTPSDLAMWMPTIVAKADGVSVRPGGGVYFVPKSGLPLWDLLVRSLRATSSHSFYGLAVMPAEDAAEAFLDAMREEADAFAMELYEKVHEMGPRARANHRTLIEKMQAKIRRYEALFGDARLEDVRATLAMVDGAIAAEALTPMGVTEG